MRSTSSEPRNGEMRLSLLLFRYLWPFWLFKDAACGDRIARAAAYRHNRSMRAHLPGYLRKWICGSALAYAMTAGFDSLALAASHTRAVPGLFTLLTAVAGMVFAAAVCVLLVTGYIYVYLGKHSS